MKVALKFYIAGVSIKENHKLAKPLDNAVGYKQTRASLYRNILKKFPTIKMAQFILPTALPWLLIGK